MKAQKFFSRAFCFLTLVVGLVLTTAASTNAVASPPNNNKISSRSSQEEKGAVVVSSLVALRGGRRGGGLLYDDHPATTTTGQRRRRKKKLNAKRTNHHRHATISTTGGHRGQRRRRLQPLETTNAGNNGDFWTYPLLQCMGDCDTDDDCEGNMICFIRQEPYQTVPGCLGGENEANTIDYCTTSDSVAPSMVPSALPTLSPRIQVVNTDDGNRGSEESLSSAAATAEEKEEEDLTDGILSFYLPGSNLAQEQQQQEQQQQQFTSNSNANNSTTTTTTTTTTTPIDDQQSEDSPLNLGQCQGLCKDDNDCMEGLTCYRRSLGGEVPFCVFDDILVKQSATLLKFCTLPPPSSPQLPMQNQEPAAPSSSPPPAASTTITTPWPTPAPMDLPPGGVPQEDDKLVQLLGNGGDVWDLGRCEGDCGKNDNNCRQNENLVCMERGRGDEAPGCYFDHGLPGSIPRESTTSICVSKSNFGNNGNSGVIIRLRLYWEPLYAWQEDRYEQFWCMEESGGQLKINRCKNYYKRQLFEMMYLEEKQEQSLATGGRRHTVGGMALIKSFRKQLCIEGGEYGGSQPLLRECNESNIEQQWIPSNGQWGTKFELTRFVDPNNATTASGGAAASSSTVPPLQPREDCLTNHHHPRGGESIEMRNCTVEREYTTSFWTIYPPGGGGRRR